MTEELLDNSHVSTGGEGEGGEGMAAAMDRQAAHIGVLVLQRIEESTVISGEVPGMPQLATRCPEYKLADTRQCGDMVGDLGH